MTPLIAYYTREGENYWDGSIRSLAKGNTERVAEYIHEAVGGELFRIETVEPYPADYYACCDAAKAELQADARPAIRSMPDAADSYDTIFIGYPNWWGVAPMCVHTFLDGIDLAGKRLIPFCTNEGSGMGGSVRLFRKLYPQAQIENGLSIHGAESEQSQATVAAWAKSMIQK